MSYRRIIQIGASGNVGAPVLQSLVASEKFEITVVARHTSNFVSPYSTVKVAKVDFNNLSELVDAFKGHEAIVLTLGDALNLDKSSKVIIDAAIEAGIKRIIPSSFGGDIVNSPGRDELVFTSKRRVDEYLAEKSVEWEFSFTSICTGPWFDWGLTHYEFIGFDIPNKKVTLYNGGNEPINVTTLGTIGAAVVSVFSNPEKFKNKILRISDFYISQKEILAILEEEVGQFTVHEIDADKLQEDANHGLNAGEWNQMNVFGAVTASVFAKRSNSRWGPNDDSNALGLAKKDLKAEIKKLL